MWPADVAIVVLSSLVTAIAFSRRQVWTETDQQFDDARGMDKQFFGMAMEDLPRAPSCGVA